MTWEVTRNGGTVWEAITNDLTATTSADGLTLSVVGSTTHNGYQYRATAAAAATNTEGSATSQTAKLTTTAKAPTNKPDTGEDKSGTELALTGSETAPMLLLVTLVTLLIAGGVTMRVARRRTTQ